MEQKTTSLLVMAEDSPESYSPAGVRVHHLALASSSRFDKIIVLTLRSTKVERRSANLKSRVSLCAVNFSHGLPFPLSALFDPIKSLVLFAHGLKLGRNIKPSFIISSMPPVEVGMSAWLLSRLFHVRLIIDLRDDWESAVETQLARYFPKPLVSAVSVVAKQVYSSSSLIFSVTETIANVIRERGIRTNIVVVPNGADTSLFRPQGIGSRNKLRREYSLPVNKMIVVYSGSGVNPYYRLDLVLESLKLLSKSAKERLFFSFFVYNGQGYLEKLRRRLGISDELLEIRSPLPHRQLAEALSACDIGLVPFDSKPYLLCARSTKIYEYLSSGLYVVSSGPRGGELDSLLSASPELGSFTLPGGTNFAQALLQVVERAANLLADNSRVLRYEFIRENYDRQSVMNYALNNMLRSMTRENQGRYSVKT